MVVDEVRVEEIHTPSLALGREAAKKQDLSTLREERP
jgi:hypothetical protein